MAKVSKGDFLLTNLTGRMCHVSYYRAVGGGIMSGYS